MDASITQVRVDESLSDYILDLVDATRSSSQVYLGASTRAALALYRTAQALALSEGRSYAIPDDIKRLVRPVLAHRILLKSMRQAGQRDASEVFLGEILESVAVPA